ncbi:MAG: hypothetical protein COS87_03300 [Chloroflexi bacterium CG07_land_8_20_14_0_80_45_17]|nr:MAG: hypothetical protein COS87_03300 [Chloroflexi bacterium CG07_land_8_20_14_0_80_45_17]
MGSQQHHTVSRIYLEGFCIPSKDRVAVLDLKTGEIRQQKPKKILRQHDYFRQRHAPEGKDEFILEEEMGQRIESQLRGIIDKLVLGGQGLTEDELITFILHLELQRLRVPKQALFAKSIAKGLIENVAYSIPGVAKELRKGWYEIKIKDEFRFTFLRNMTGKLFPYIRRMAWDVWEAPEGYSFITSDNPVTIFNTRVHPPDVAGIGLLGSTVLFPLTPHHCLELTHPEVETEENPDFLQPIELKPFDVGYVHIRAGRIMTENIAYLANCLVGTEAERYLVGSDINVLAEVHEALKTGRPRPDRNIETDRK